MSGSTGPPNPAVDADACPLRALGALMREEPVSEITSSVPEQCTEHRTVGVSSHAQIVHRVMSAHPAVLQAVPEEVLYTTETMSGYHAGS